MEISSVRRPRVVLALEIIAFHKVRPEFYRGPFNRLRVKDVHSQLVRGTNFQDTVNVTSPRALANLQVGLAYQPTFL